MKICSFVFCLNCKLLQDSTTVRLIWSNAKTTNKKTHKLWRKKGSKLPACCHLVSALARRASDNSNKQQAEADLNKKKNIRKAKGGIKVMSLGYTFKSHWNNKTHLKSCSSVFDLFSIELHFISLWNVVVTTNTTKLMDPNYFYWLRKALLSETYQLFMDAHRKHSCSVVGTAASQRPLDCLY